MTTTPVPKAIRPGKLHVRDLRGGIKLEAQVSPCVFMYPGYPLQVQVTLRTGVGTASGVAFAVDRTLTAETAFEADVSRLLSAVGAAPCSRCSQPAFDPATIETNRGGLCEFCFVGNLEAKWARLEKAEKRRLANRDRRMKSKGMRVRVTAWIHSAAESDDVQVDWYFDAQPTPVQIRKLLRQEGSAVLDDFQIFTLYPDG